MRASAGTWPDDAELTGLIAELSSQSPEFRRIWDSGEVMNCTSGHKRLHHPVTGTLSLDFEALHVPAAPGETGLVVHVFSAGSDAAAAEALARLGAAVDAGRGGPAARRADIPSPRGSTVHRFPRPPLR